jgi:hypothetical protein
MDAIMAVTFAVNTLLVVYNVYLKWLETRGQLECAERIDRVFDWVYPFTYMVAFTIIYVWFFRTLRRPPASVTVYFHAPVSHLSDMIYLVRC